MEEVNARASEQILPVLFGRKYNVSYSMPCEVIPGGEVNSWNHFLES